MYELHPLESWPMKGRGMCYCVENPVDSYDPVSFLMGRKVLMGKTVRTVIGVEPYAHASLHKKGELIGVLTPFEEEPAEEEDLEGEEFHSTPVAPTGVMLTLAECQFAYDLMGKATGGNPENCFHWDGTDDKHDPTASYCAKIFSALGEDIPESLR